MATIVKKSLNNAEKIQTPEKLKSETVSINGVEIQRVTVEPGWQWTKHLRPILGGDSCQIHHLLYVISGTLKVKMNDGSVQEISSGDVVDIPAGHDGWNEGNEPVVWVELPH